MGKNQDPGSGINNLNIPDPQHCRERTEEDREEVVIRKGREEDREEVVIRKGSIKSKYSKMSEADLYGFSCPR